MGVIDTAYISNFNSAIRSLTQQNKSKLRPAVDFEMLKAEQGFIERLGLSVLEDVPSRHGDTPVSDPDHTRRRITASRKVGGHYVDTADQARILILPAGRYARAQAMAANREIDRAIITAFAADVYGGKDGGTTVTFANDGRKQIAAGGADLTIAKLVEAKEHFIDVHADGEMHIVVSSKQASALMNLTAFQTFDNRNSKALESGDIGSGFMGFNWHVMGSNTTKGAALPVDGSSVRSCYAWIKDAMVLGMTQDVTTMVDRIPSKQGSILIQTHIDVGCTRIEGEQVVEILCDES